MTTLQNDLLEIYNSLVLFSKETLQSPIQHVIKVWYEKDSRLLVFEQRGNSARLSIPNYYCLSLENLEKPTYLLPRDYDYLMYNLQTVINSGLLLEDRTCLSPDDYGFDIYALNKKEYGKGPKVIGTIKFISGNSWLFKLITKWKLK